MMQGKCIKHYLCPQNNRPKMYVSQKMREKVQHTLAGRRRAVFFTRGKNENENINVVFTQVSGDYTKIGAFGTSLPHCWYSI